ncbi:MAG TPA: Hsp20/alpha crystallin family protein [Pyrinomonadaceae bacterium]|nr:Hsp20/alpha crystallin family protein [Pyrinomonadaceae bacterium]
MNVVRYDPFRELRGLQNEVNRLFSGAMPRDREDMLGGAWNPRVDIFENKDQLVLEAELPGMSSDDFDLSFENNVLTLKGERKFEKNTTEGDYHRIERGYGSFTRSFTLPQTVTADGAKAEFDNGVLRVSLPKREETKARKIEVLGAKTKPKTIETSNTASNEESKSASA